jgi:hypothetical protein
MMKRAWLLLLLFVPAVIGVSAAAQRQAAPDAPLEGVWQILEVRPTGPGAKPVYRPNIGFWIFTAKHYAVIVDDAPSPRPELGDPSKATADQLRAVWGPFVGNAGTYERSRDMFTYRVLVAKSPGRMKGKDYASWSVKVEGDTLTAVELSSQSGPATNPTTVILKRVE